MPVDYTTLPVYEQKQRILDTLEHNQVIVVQSPTGSGKTTQIPIILHEAGYSSTGIIAVTQPRRIAALSVSEFIARQLKTTYPGLVGYKMRFEDKTDNTTRIKIMTDGILLQEMKLDPWLSKYSVMMVDEAHERSLNIDFVLGLLKRILAERKEFKVIVSSATMNTEAFANYFDGCPVVTIDTITYPVTVVYDTPTVPITTATTTGCDILLGKIEETISRVLDNRAPGDILCFLPGEKIIKDPTLAEGKKILEQSGHTGYTARLWKIVKINGEETERTVFNNSTYMATSPTYRVGTKKEEATTEEEDKDKTTEKTTAKDETATKKTTTEGKTTQQTTAATTARATQKATKSTQGANQS